MASYRYIFGSLRTDRVIAEIPLQGTYMDNELNVGGRLDGSFHLDMTGYDNQTLMDATIPGRCFVVCERDGVPVWCGYVWSRTYQSQAKSVQLYAQTFEYYPSHEFIRVPMDITDEQLTVFTFLWNDLQSDPTRNLSILIPSVVPPTITLKTVTVDPSDFKYYSELMSSLSDAADGFDWTIDISKSGGQYFKTLRYGYPTLGSPDPARLVFEYPGCILNYYCTESMVDSGTNVFMLGAGEGSTMIFSEVVHQDLLDSGSPRWDVAAARKDIGDQDNLNSFAQQEAAIRRPPMITLKPSMKGDKVPEFGSFGLGDACTVAIQDARFPEGINFATRITKWTLQPSSAENTEEYSVFFEGDSSE